MTRHASLPVLLAPALLLAGCLSTNVESVACRDDRGCAPGNHCDGGTCEAIPTPAPRLAAGECPGPDVGTHPNLLPDPGFECFGNPARWVTSDALVALETTEVHSGTNALRLGASASGTSESTPPTLTSTAPFLVQTAGTYCASGWVRGRAQGVELRLLRSQGAGGGVVSTSLAPTETTWTAIPTPHASDPQSRGLAIEALQGDALTVQVVLTQPGAGDYLVLDDLALWQAPVGGGCGD